MLESLLRRLWATGWRRGRSGSRVWMVVAMAAGGVRLVRFVSRDRDDILYRTRVVPGDQFEIVATPPVKKGRRK
ncbi:MAG: hypothetical protein QOG50_1713 [Actinomycetota bacterium]|jgi:hypothetical protein|nr:hypothetical protein [Actinomycetota bacterium]